MPKKTDSPTPDQDQDITVTPERLEEGAVKAENQALRAQMDQLMDMIIEQREELDRVKVGQMAAPPPATSTLADELDAELQSLTEEYKDYAMINVFAQRTVAGMEASQEIRLKDELSVLDDPKGDRRRWKLRWFNFAKEGRAQQAASEGYEKVHWDQLADEEAVIGSRQDDFVRKGERGLEVLHRMPMKLYAYKKKRDAVLRAGEMQSESKVRNMVASRVAGMAQNSGGNADQAGSTVHDEFSLSITEGPRETITL